MKCVKHPKYKGKSAPRDCEACQEIYEFQQLKADNLCLQNQVNALVHVKQIPVHRYTGEYVKFGVVSDTHLGSLYERLDYLKLAYQLFKQEGIKTVYHCGDILDGEKIYRGQEYEIHNHGATAQVEHCVSQYPMIAGMITYYILGNHDLSFWKTCGIDVGQLISLQRHDMHYMGREFANVKMNNAGGEVIIQLVHPGKGTSYACSYHPQKYVESLTGGEKPNMVLIGHYHKSEWLPNYRNVEVIQAGCMQSQTPFMKRQNIAAMIGFWIVEFKIHKNSISRCRSEFFPYYEKSVI